MPTSSLLAALRRSLNPSHDPSSPKPSSTLPYRLSSVLHHSWHLGFTSFGGPPVHFQIFHTLYVDKLAWIDEAAYQELFAICQALPGPGSTKMLYCIHLIRHGSLAAIFAFLIWSLPGALGMFALAVGVNRIDATLPAPVYALLSGLNSATVGIIALAAVQLSGKAITDRWTRVLVFLGATAGMLYNALWYFPLLIALAAIATVVFDLRWLHGVVSKTWHALDPRRRQTDPSLELGDRTPSSSIVPPNHTQPTDTPLPRLRNPQPPMTRPSSSLSSPSPPAPAESPTPTLSITWRTGLLICFLFLLTYVPLLTLRSVLHPPALALRLFFNIYLAGTIIFGGGPVVIPLLREYTVAPGWVTPRDFLLGLAIIQAFPGPNFNFAVYLGALGLLSGGDPAGGNRVATACAGAVAGYVAIFLPGLWLVHGTMGLWARVRRWRAVRAGLRGMNAVAVGLIFTAVYRLFEIGWVRADAKGGSSLGGDPWWVVCVATSFVGGMWFGLPAPAAILLGGVMGMVWYAVVVA